MTFLLIWALVLALVGVCWAVSRGIKWLNKHAPDVLDWGLGALLLLGFTAVIALLIWSFTL